MYEAYKDSLTLRSSILSQEVLIKKLDAIETLFVAITLYTFACLIKTFTGKKNKVISVTPKFLLAEARNKDNP
jgi:hypothetical protein